VKTCFHWKSSIFTLENGKIPIHLDIKQPTVQQYVHTFNIEILMKKKLNIAKITYHNIFKLKSTKSHKSFKRMLNFSSYPIKMHFTFHVA
jgi:hypothetical protein